MFHFLYFSPLYLRLYLCLSVSSILCILFSFSLPFKTRSSQRPEDYGLHLPLYLLHHPACACQTGKSHTIIVWVTLSSVLCSAPTPTSPLHWSFFTVCLLHHLTRVSRCFLFTLFHIFLCTFILCSANSSCDHMTLWRLWPMMLSTCMNTIEFDVLPGWAGGSPAARGYFSIVPLGQAWDV